MSSPEIIKHLGLEPQHFKHTSVDIPVVDPGLYTTMGRRLFDLYQKYSIPAEDQRDIEALSFILQSFVLSQSSQSSSFKRFWLRLRSKCKI